MIKQNTAKKTIFSIVFFIVSLLFLGLGQFCFLNIRQVEAEAITSYNERGYYVQTSEHDSNQNAYFYVSVGTSKGDGNARTLENETLIGDGKTYFVKAGQTIVMSFARKSAASGELAICKDDKLNLESTMTDTSFVEVDLSCKNENGTTVITTSENEDGAHQYFYHEIDEEDLIGGRYDFKISYNFNDGAETVHNQFTYSIFLLKDSTYNDENGTPNISYGEGVSNVYTNSSVVAYDRFFNYQQKLNASAGDFVLPEIAYNHNLYEIEFTRSFEGFIYNYKFVNEGGKVVCQKSDVNAPDIKFEKASATRTIITLKDLGVYNVFYKYITIIDGEIVELDTIHEVKKDVLNIFGYQAFYSDYQKDLTEFRSEKNLNVVADVTYKGYESLLELENDETMKNFIPGSGSEEGKVYLGTPVSTNQAPVRLKFNVAISNQVYYKYDNGAWIKHTDQRTVFTDPGIYFVEIEYTYESYKYSSGNNVIADGSYKHKQQFYFEITTSTPTIDIADSKGNAIYSGSYTKNDVKITKRIGTEFDSGVKVIVSRADFASPTNYKLESEISDDVVSQEFSREGKYKVEIKYGKNYQKTNCSYFTIDKTEITGLDAKIVTMADYTDIFVRGKSVSDLITNLPFAFEWNEKPSGAQITCDYQLIPLVDSNIKVSEPSFVDVANNQVWIANGWNFVWDGTANFVPYTNTLGRTTVSGSQILNEAGIYLFNLKDQAGHEASFYMILDNTKVKFLQKRLNGETYEYFEPTALNNVANDTVVEWGSHKLIGITGITKSNVASSDIGRLKGFFDKYFQDSKGYVDYLNNTVVFKNKIQEVFVVTDLEGSTSISGSEYNVKVLGDNGLPKEQIYKFYAVDSSNKKVNVGSNFDSVDTSKYSGTHSIKVSTDMAKGMLVSNNQLSFDANKNLRLSELDQYGLGVVMPLDPNDPVDVNPENIEDYLKLMSLKNYYFTNKDVIYFAYIKDIDENIQVSDITINYYKLEYNNTLKTYEYSKVPTQITGFDVVEWTEYNDYLASQGDTSKYYLIAINPTENGLTAAGKYSIVRQYDQSKVASDISVLANKYDYLTREYVFFVDRNPLVTGPSIHGEDEILAKDVGEYIRLYVLAGNDNQVLFDAFYRQSQLANKNNLSAINSILITNKLPVKIYIPLAKYGYDENGTFKTDSVNGNIITAYDGQNITQVLHPNVYMRAKITYKNKAGKLVSSTYSNMSIVNGYLAIPNISEAFGEVVGTYYVEIYDGMGNEWFFAFEIKSEAPKMDFVSVTNNGETKVTLGSSQKYTNADALRIEWTDPADEYSAKIAKGYVKVDQTTGTEKEYSEIYYTINGVKYSVFPSQIQTEGATHYFVISQKVVNGETVALSDGDKIVVYAHFEGEVADYPQGSYYFEREINIDYTAPVLNLQNMIDGVIISNQQDLNQTRIVGNKYNKTIRTGELAYYSYAIGKDFTFASSYNTQEATSLYYRRFANKYSQEVMEVNLPTDPDALGSNIFNPNNGYSILNTTRPFGQRLASGLYEIVEIDTAGNYTAYTVYLYSDLTEFLSFKYDTQAESNVDIIFDNAEGELSVFNKFVLKNLNINDDMWWRLSIRKDGEATSSTFRKTPMLSDGEVYVGGSTQKIALQDAYAFENNSKYIIEISDRQSKAYKQVAVYIANMSRRFEVEFIEMRDGFDVQINNDEILQIKDFGLGGLTVSMGTLVGTNYVYEQLEYSYQLNPTGIRLSVLSKDATKLYKVSIKTNFATTQDFYYVYGQAQVEEEITGEDLITTDAYYDYISSHDVNFTYNNLLYSVSVGYGSQNYVGAITKVDNGNLTTITLQAASFVYQTTEYVGEERTFSIVITPLVNSENGVFAESRTLNVKIDNRLPQVNLYNDYGENQNVLFSGAITRQGVVIRFVEDETSKVYLRLRGDNEFVEIASGHKVNDIGTYEIMCKKTTELTASYTKYFTITKSELSVYAVVGSQSEFDENVEYLNPSKNFYLYQNQTLPYYVTNLPYVAIRTDSSLQIATSYVTLPSKDGAVTMLFTISNMHAENQSIYINDKIVVSIIPKSNVILNNFYKIGSDGFDVAIEDLVSDREIVTSTVADAIEQVSGSEKLTLGWDSYYLEPNNKILVTYSFNDQIIFEKEEISRVVLSTSGKHTFKFEDMAGNVHIFTQNIQQSNSFDFYFIKSVVFTVNDKDPIDFAVYNDKVVLKVPDESLKFYNSSSVPQIVVKRNGEEYSVSGKNRTWEISEKGFYEVYFLAKWLDKYILTDPIHFTILNPNESRLAYEYVGVENYEIISIKKGDAEMLENKTLKVFAASCDDENTGEGRYTITVRAKQYDELMPVQEFAFSFWLHKAEPPVVVSVDQGTETTKVINVQFNAHNIYNEVGDCYVQITNMDPIYINASTLASMEELQSIDIENAGDYFIQIYTQNGSLVYSYRVIKKDPLNGVTIALICIGVAVVIALTIIFVKLRKKVKIR